MALHAPDDARGVRLVARALLRGSGNMYERFFPWACEAGNPSAFSLDTQGCYAVSPRPQAVLTGRASIDMWHRLRPATVIGSVISMRFELERNGPVPCRFAMCPVSVYVELDGRV